MILFALLLSLRLSPETPDTQYKQPQLAVSENLVAVAFGSGNSIYVATSHDGAAGFSKPHLVARPAHLALGRHRGPRIAFSKSMLVISAITGIAGQGRDGDLVAWRSSDGGKTWSAPSTVTDRPAAAREGMHAMTASPDGVLLATWLDLRDGKMKLYGSMSKDSGATWSKNRLVYASPDGEICTCCHPSAYATADGKFHVMWRNDLGGSRDMWLASSSTQGRTWAAQKLGRGTWPLNACPMDGGGLTVDRGKLVSAWRRDGAVYLAQPGEQERRLGRGKDPAIAGRYVAWTDELSIKVAQAGQDPVTLSEDGAFVSMAGVDAVYAAWEEKGAIVVRKLGD